MKHQKEDMIMPNALYQVSQRLLLPLSRMVGVSGSVGDQNYTHSWFSHSFPSPQELLGTIKGHERQRNDSAFHSEKNKPENGMVFPLLIMC